VMRDPQDYQFVRETRRLRITHHASRITHKLIVLRITRHVSPLDSPAESVGGERF
jgi:hypothetical protein